MTQRDEGHDYRDSKNKAEAHERKQKEKKDLIEELEGILKANKDNIYCDKYQLQNMIEEAFRINR